MGLLSTCHPKIICVQDKDPTLLTRIETSCYFLSVSLLGFSRDLYNQNLVKKSLLILLGAEEVTGASWLWSYIKMH